MLEEQVRIQKEQTDCTLREVDEKYSEKEKTINEELDAVNKKLTSALAEIIVKDNLVKEHIKVAEEAVIGKLDLPDLPSIMLQFNIAHYFACYSCNWSYNCQALMVLLLGWERAENETAAFKLQLDDAIQQQLATEDRVQHLDNALKEVTNQLHIGREEQEQRIHEIIVEKSQEYDQLQAEMHSKEQLMHETIVKRKQEYDELRAEMDSKLAEASHIVDQTRAEMESKLAEASHIVAQTRAEHMESRAENQALSNALQV
jgi:hypothetical protein